MEIQIGNILEKLKEYERELYYLIKESGQRMEQVTSSLCAVAASLDKKNNEEIMSLHNVGMGSLGVPSKRTRQSMRKKVTEALEALALASAEII